MAARVVVLGGINIDLVTETETLPQRGQTIFARDFKRFGGGKGANQALAAARMGAVVALIGRVGDDEPGRYLLGELARDGVDVSDVVTTPGPTGTAFITVDGEGANTIVVVSGANSVVSAADVEAVRVKIEAADALVLGLEAPMEASLRAAQIAHAAGVAVFLNPSPVQPLPDELLAHTSYLVLNEGELRALSGSSDDPNHLLSRGVGALVVTLGERGARLVRGSGTHEVDAYPVRTVDTTAAGDAFLGALAATTTDLGIESALSFAAAAGAIATTRWGAQPSLPARAEVEALVRRGRGG